MKHFKLAYPLGTVNWNGKSVTKLDDKFITSALDRFKRAGLSDVMLAGYHCEELFEFDVDAETRHIGSLLAEYGMHPTQMHAVAATWGGTPAEQKSVIDNLEKCIDYTANLKADNMVIHMGRKFGHYETVEEFLQIYTDAVEKDGFESVLARNVEAIHEAGLYAASRNVKIALENIDRFEPLGSPEELPLVVNGVNLPSVGYCFDSGHAWCSGSDLEKWIRTMGKKMYTTHFHDNRGPKQELLKNRYFSCAGIDEHLTPGLGTIDWRKVIAAVEQFTDLDTITFETGPWRIDDPDDAFHCAIQFWRMLETKAGQERKQNA